MKIGFTGTLAGMVEIQWKKVWSILKDNNPEEGHHGCATGADSEFHEICRSLGIPIIGHPPINEEKMMVIKPIEFLRLCKPQPYIVRNHDIVDETDRLIGCPKSRHEELRSGTWATIRYARRPELKRPIFMVLP